MFADSYRGLRVVAGLPAKFQLQARRTLVCGRRSRGSDTNSKCSAVGHEVAEFDDQLFPSGKNNNVIRNGRNLGSRVSRFPRIFCATVTPRDSRGRSGTEVLVVSGVGSGSVLGGLAFDFSFQCFRIILVLVSDCFELFLLLGPHIGRGGLHRNSPKHQVRPRSSYGGPFQGLSSQRAVGLELDDRHLQVF